MPLDELVIRAVVVRSDTRRSVVSPADGRFAVGASSGKKTPSSLVAAVPANESVRDSEMLVVGHRTTDHDSHSSVS
jgi:hypothetical protein